MDDDCKKVDWREQRSAMIRRRRCKEDGVATDEVDVLASPIASGICPSLACRAVAYIRRPRDNTSLGIIENISLWIVRMFVLRLVHGSRRKLQVPAEIS